jgi:hypothetical protein
VTGAVGEAATIAVGNRRALARPAAAWLIGVRAAVRIGKTGSPAGAALARLIGTRPGIAIGEPRGGKVV